MEKNNVEIKPRILSVIRFPNERIDKLIVDSSNIVDDAVRIAGRDDAGSNHYREVLEYRAETLSLNFEDYKDNAKRILSRVANDISSSVKIYLVGYNRFVKRYEKLPDDPVLHEGDIRTGSWITPLMHDDQFDLDFAMSMVNHKDKVSNSIEELIVVIDKSKEYGYSKLLAGDRFTKMGVSKATAKSVRLLKLLSLSMQSTTSMLSIPGGVLAVVLDNPDGSNSVKWRKIKYKDYNEVFDISDTVSPATPEDYKEVKEAIGVLLTIYSTRIRGHTKSESKVMKTSESDFSDDNANSKKDLRDLNASIAMEDAITASIKRVIDGLLTYLEKSKA